VYMCICEGATPSQVTSLPSSLPLAPTHPHLRMTSITLGTVGNEQKFYFYTKQEDSDELFLIEVIVDLRNRTMVAHLKCQDENAGHSFHSYMESALRTLFFPDKQF
jgi:Beta2-adaptin appendage, C-terminal sub-domain